MRERAKWERKLVHMPRLCRGVYTLGIATLGNTQIKVNPFYHYSDQGCRKLLCICQAVNFNLCTRAYSAYKVARTIYLQANVQWCVCGPASVLRVLPDASASAAHMSLTCIECATGPAIADPAGPVPTPLHIMYKGVL